MATKKTADKAAEKVDEPLLTLPELAVYLHLDEKTVYKLVATGKLPSVTVDRVWRFKRRDVDQWLERELNSEDESFADIPDGMKIPLEDLLPDAAIITDLKAKTPVSVIEELAARAYANGWLTDKPWFVGAVVERESLSSTAMEGGVAFLHTRAKDKGKISRPFLVCGRSWEGIAFGAPDGRPTFLFFLMGLKYDKLHLPILGRLARSLRNPTTIAKLRAMSSPDKLRALLLREDEAARAGLLPDLPPPTYAPKLDKTLRLRALRRLDAQHKAEAEKADRAEKAPAKSRRKAAAAAAAAGAVAGAAPVAAGAKVAASKKPTVRAK
ncbi:MAG TPA: PTS sugar transporter subunit IIA [Kofleriaceae bacterium]|nr:PTS sugar transporter subunit IIA [Kofleriaceae bacterium]